MKKFLFYCFVILMLFERVQAKPYYYINGYGVEFTLEEYNYVSELLYDGYQATMTKEEYKIIFSENMNTIKKTIIDTPVYSTLGTFYASSSKNINIATSCDSTCLVTVAVNWTKSPNIRSYDLIGAFLEDTSLTTNVVTKSMNSTGVNVSNEIKNDKNGFGVSIELLKKGDDMRITQIFRVNKGGWVYSSYQHAMKSITLANSKKYSIQKGGYGGVFLFDSLKIQDYYDGMQGVYVQL